MARLTYAQVAERAGVSVYDVRRLADGGLLDDVKLRDTVGNHMGFSGKAVGRVKDLITQAEHRATFPTIEGVKASDRKPDVSRLWQSLIHRQGRVQSRADAKLRQRITLPGNLPTAIVFISDIHFGDSFTDYAQVYADAQVIRETPGMYAILAGDMVDNWITPKLQWIQRHQAVPLEDEWALCEDYLQNQLGDKLLAVVSGNHDARTDQLGGIDYLKLLLQNADVLYDQNEVIFQLCLGGYEWGVKVRHKWRGRSEINQTHGIEKDLRLGSDDWDIGVGGHTHAATTFREFVYHDRLRLAVQLGTYKFDDHYGAQCGFPRTVGNGSGAVVFYPSGEWHQCRNVEMAAKVLRVERGF